MIDTKNSDDKTLTVTPKKATLSLGQRTVERGTVRQSFSHGRTKAVVVEKKKSRGASGDGAPAPAAGAPRRQLTPRSPTSMSTSTTTWS